jgi:hypothetical protein
MHLAFDEGAEPGELTVGTALTEIVPLHSLMSEKIEAVGAWEGKECIPPLCSRQRVQEAGPLRQ